jgi:uncharacterized protein (TIGR00661 family)
VTAGGFESPAEAIYLGKKVLSVPMHNQYEQLCNAVAMKDIGVTVVKKIDENFGHKLKTWLEFGSAPSIHYPDQTAAIIEDAIMEQQQLPTFAQAIQA